MTLNYTEFGNYYKDQKIHFARALNKRSQEELVRDDKRDTIRDLARDESFDFWFGPRLQDMDWCDDDSFNCWLAKWQTTSFLVYGDSRKRCHDLLAENGISNSDSDMRRDSLRDFNRDFSRDMQRDLRKSLET